MSALSCFGRVVKSYKRGTLSFVIKKIATTNIVPLGRLCKIRTGKLDANAMVSNGAYRFYTCAKDYYFIDSFAFDTDALLVSGNGANVGYIHHYKGKFNAYQRTYVLDKFKDADIEYIQYFLEENLRFRIESEKKSGNTPYIVLSALSEMNIKLPSLEERRMIAAEFSLFDRIIDNEQRKLSSFLKLQSGLMQNLFI